MKARPRPTLIVPDEASWTVWGVDPAARGLTPASTPEEALGLLVPEVVPDALAGPLRAQLARASARPRVIAERGPAVLGPHVAELLRGAGRSGEPGTGRSEEHGGHEDHGGHDEHGDNHDNHDMMAIVGEPSADGLVMEPIELELGPLSWVLPGGLVASLRFEGDLVASCELRSTLAARDGQGSPVADPLAPVAWAVAGAVAVEQARGAPAQADVAWRRAAAVELERAVSHLAWLRTLGRLLGWAELVRRAQRALDPVIEARRDAGLAGTAAGPPPGSAKPASDLADRRLALAGKRARRLTSLLDGRRLAARARGRGRPEGEAVLAGPNGRAAGSPRDARNDDPLYVALGFEPVVGDAGDAEARILVRAREAAAAVELAAGAIARLDGSGDLAPPAANAVAPATAGAASPTAVGGRPERTGFASPAGAAVEGPRGPVLASTTSPREAPLVAAPGAAAHARAAAAAATGQEWSAALLTIASFDLSGWRVPR